MRGGASHSITLKYGVSVKSFPVGKNNCRGKDEVNIWNFLRKKEKILRFSLTTFITLKTNSIQFNRN